MSATLTCLSLCTFYTLCSEWLMGIFLWQLSSEQGQLEMLARHWNRSWRTYKSASAGVPVSMLQRLPCFLPVSSPAAMLKCLSSQRSPRPPITVLHAPQTFCPLLPQIFLFSSFWNISLFPLSTLLSPSQFTIHTVWVQLTNKNMAALSSDKGKLESSIVSERPH